MARFLKQSFAQTLSDLLTTSATHDTFSRPSTKPGLILIDLELNTYARESFEHCWSHLAMAMVIVIGWQSEVVPVQLPNNIYRLANTKDLRFST